MGYLSQYSTKQTPQSEPIPGSTQVANSAGGYAWSVDVWTRLERFLILGAEGGTYYIGERDLVRENAGVVLEALKLDGGRAVRLIRDISFSGRAPKQSPALFALAMAAASDDESTRLYALDSINSVVRTGSHLFEFLGYVQQFRGWGRGLRNAVGRWYAAHAEKGDLDYQLIKYRQRAGWTHRDVLRQAHIRTVTADHPGYERMNAFNASLRWAVGKEPRNELEKPGALLAAFDRAQRVPESRDTVELIKQFPDLPREALKPEHLVDPDVWAALLDNGMPMTALLRNLANMTRIGLLAPMGWYTKLVTDQLTDAERLRKARVHPINLLIALRTYASGHGQRSSNIWTPTADIVDALDAAFYKSFEFVEPTGKAHMLAIDVSASMEWPGNRTAGGALTSLEAAGAMAMVTAAREPHMVVAFSREMIGVTISPRQRLDDVLAQLRNLLHGGTDVAQPILAAQRNGLKIDQFVVYTDNETWAGSTHPAQALRSYRQTSGIPAKLAAVAMSANEYSVGDPNDPGTLNVVGFDASVPAVLADFAKGSNDA